MRYNHSVIIPYRDTLEMLHKAVSSIPDREDIQVIIVDNSVTPLTEDKIPVKRKATIVYAISDSTMGAGRARNVGIKHAQGKFLIFLDADDYFTPTAFESFDKFINQDYDIVCFNATSIKIPSGNPSNRHLVIDKLIKEYLETGNDDYIRFHFENPVSKMVRRSIVEDFHIRYQEVPASNDTMFQVWLGYRAKKVTANDEVVYVITEGDAGSSITKRRTVRNQFSRFCVAITHYKFMEEIGRPDLRYRLFSYIIHALIDFGPVEAFRWICYAFKNKVNPFHYYNWQMDNILNKIVNKLLRPFFISNMGTYKKVVYLTFDDGPEPGITEFVLNELGKYGFKATFFCRGDNAEKYTELLAMICEEGHAIGNHTYSHLHSYETSRIKYVRNVERADEILHTSLFRPPHGSLTLPTWWKLKSRKIVFWALNSEDSELGYFDYGHAIANLKKNTHAGDVVLFHFCHRHEKETKLILPAYLQWLKENGYKAEVIN